MFSRSEVQSMMLLHSTDCFMVYTCYLMSASASFCNGSVFHCAESSLIGIHYFGCILCHYIHVMRLLLTINECFTKPKPIVDT